MKLFRNQSGQGMTEYIIIVALIALAAIAAFSYFGKTVRNETAAMSQSLAGDSADAQKKLEAAGQAATEGSADNVTGDMTLKDYAGKQGAGK